MQLLHSAAEVLSLQTTHCCFSCRSCVHDHAGMHTVIHTISAHDAPASLPAWAALTRSLHMWLMRPIPSRNEKFRMTLSSARGCRIGSVTLPQFAAASTALVVYFSAVILMNSRAKRDKMA